MRILRINPKAVDLCERIVFGGALRERFAKMILTAHYGSRHRRHWTWRAHYEPHFTDHEINFFRLYSGNVDQSIYGLTRAFLSADAVSQGDVVLDIGCGDGGFTKRFLAPKASHVDAIDIEGSAIKWAGAKNPAPNITYLQSDAVHADFPRQRYDLVVFDGAIGHISKPDAAALLGKIAQALGPKGMFVGSESLGTEGSDHLQFFVTVEDLRAFLATHFAVVRLKTVSYEINNGSYLRTEAYWRCGQDFEIVDWCGWS